MSVLEVAEELLAKLRLNRQIQLNEAG